MDGKKLERLGMTMTDFELNIMLENATAYKFGLFALIIEDLNEFNQVCKWVIIIILDYFCK